MAIMFSLFLFLSTYVFVINGHGYLLDPPGRSTAWLVDPSFKQCCTYPDHMGMYCGGLQVQWRTNGGKCSICGEAYNAPNKLFDKGGAMYTGRIVKTYNQGQQIEVSVVLTANHRGHFEFRLCNLDSNPNADATQECLDRGILTIAGTGSTRLRNVEQFGSGPNPIRIRVQLPSNVACRHCVFQWKYTAGNNWGTDPVTGESGPGMGVENETFMGCADISIVGDGSPGTTNPPPVITSSSTTSGSTVPTRPPTTRGPPTGGAAHWSPDGVAYNVGDLVTYEGAVYECTYFHVSYPGAHPSSVTWAIWKLRN